MPGSHYAGELNEDSTEVRGTWLVAGNWSGTFMMMRSRTAETAASKEAVERR